MASHSWDGVARRTSAVLGVPPGTGANPDSAGATGFWTTQTPQRYSPTTGAGSAGAAFCLATSPANREGTP